MADDLDQQLLASMGLDLNDPSGGLADQIAALQGLEKPKEQSVFGKLTQPIRTGFGYLGAPAGYAAGILSPEAYDQAAAERQASEGITAESPWYRRAEALPNLGDVAANMMSPEFRASGLGHVVEPVTRIGGAIAGDPSTYVGGALAKGASGVAGRVAPELVAAGAAAATDAERASIAAQIADKVLSEGTGFQRGLFNAGQWANEGQALALAAPAAIAYGPQTLEAAYHQVKNIPQSEHPVADSASALLLTGMLGLMGKGLMDAGSAANLWKTRAMAERLSPAEVQAGERQIIEAAGVHPVLPEELNAVPEGLSTVSPLEGGEPVQNAAAAPETAPVAPEAVPAATTPEIAANAVPVETPVTEPVSTPQPKPKRARGKKQTVTQPEAPITEQNAPVTTPEPVEAKPVTEEAPPKSPEVQNSETPAAAQPAENKAPVEESTNKPTVEELIAQAKADSEKNPVTPAANQAEVDAIHAAEAVPEDVHKFVGNQLADEYQKGKNPTKLLGSKKIEQAIQKQFGVDEVKAKEWADAIRNDPRDYTPGEPIAAKPVEKPVENPQAPAQAAPVAEEKPLNAKDKQLWSRIPEALADVRAAGKGAENEANKLLADDFEKRVQAADTPEKQRALIKEARDGYRGYWKRMIQQRGSTTGSELTPAQATKASTKVEAGGKAPTNHDQLLQQAVDHVRANNESLQAFLDKNVDKRLLPNSRAWKTYVEAIDAGKSVGEARAAAMAGIDAKSVNAVKQALYRGNKAWRDALADENKFYSKKRAAAENEGKIKEATQRQAEAQAATDKLLEIVKGAGGVDEKMLANQDFKNAVEGVLDAAAAHKSYAGKVLGGNHPLNKSTYLRELGKAVGLTEKQLAPNRTAAELMQAVAKKVGIEKNYANVLKAQTTRKAAEWKPDIVSKKPTVSGNDKSFTLSLDKPEADAMARDIKNNPGLTRLNIPDDTKASEIKKLEAQLPEGVTLKARKQTPAMEAAGRQVYDVQRPKAATQLARDASGGKPTNELPAEAQALRAANYAEDYHAGEDIGDGLKVVNHDRVMSNDYLDHLGSYGKSLAAGLQRVHNRIVAALGKALPLAEQTEFSGLTASPQLSGLYQGLAGENRGRVFLNPVEAINYNGSYDATIDDMLYTLAHEISHHRSLSHGEDFSNMNEYVKGLVQGEKMMDDLRRELKAAFSEEDFKQLQGLVPDFNEARDTYGGSVGELPNGNLEGGAAASENRYGRTQEGAADNLPAGVQRGNNVPGSPEGETGQLRAGSAAGGSGSEGSAQGESARPSVGGSVEKALDRFAESRARTKTATREQAQELMDSLIEDAKVNQRPVRDIYRHAYDLAKDVEAHLTDPQREALANSLPDPNPKKGQQLGVLNLLHLTDLDKRMKARIKLMYDFSRGAWARDRVRGWETVDSEVQHMLGIHTPQEWTRIFKTKGGGLLDRDVMLLRTVNNHLSEQLLASEDRLLEAMNNGVRGEGLDKLRNEVRYNEQVWHHSMSNITKGLTGVARALAIARHEVRSLDPVLAMEQDWKAGLRSRLEGKYKGAELEQNVQKLMDEANRIKNEGGSMEDFYKLYRSILGSKLWPDKLLEFYKAGLLGWSSRVANLSSNNLFRSVRYAEDAIAGGLDAARSSMTGAQRERFIGETAASMAALRRAGREAFPEWWNAQKNAFYLKPQEIETAFAKGGLMEDLLQHPGAIEGKLGEFIRFPFKGLSADDVFAKHIARVDSMYRQIYRRLRSGEYQKNSGESLAAATERIYSHLNDNFKEALNGGNFDSQKLKHWQQMATIAEDAAKKDTFQQDLGNFGRGANWLLRQYPAMQIFFPFLRTPSNIARESIKRTPLGFLQPLIMAEKWKAMSAGERMTELAKPAMGTLISAVIMAEAMHGDVTGGGPVDPDELEALKATGWQPYSVRVGDNWVSYQRMEPMAALAGIASDAAEGIRNGDFDKWQNGVMRVFQSGAENITNKTFLSGLDGLFSAVSHPVQYGQRFAKQMQGSIIPNSLGFIPVSGITRALDPTYRQTDPFSMSTFYAKLPFLSSTLDPQYGPTGEIRTRAGSAVERLLSPFSRTERTPGPVTSGTDEVVRLSATPRAPSRYWTARGGVRVDLTAAEKEQLARAYRDATGVIGERVIKDPTYLKLPDDENDANYRYGMKTKKEVLQRLYARYRDRVMDSLKPTLERRAAASVNERNNGGS